MFSQVRSVFISASFGSERVSMDAWLIRIDQDSADCTGADIQPGKNHISIAFSGRITIPSASSPISMVPPSMDVHRNAV